jgi:hypothetical protein
MTRIPGRPHARHGRELMSLLASARPASLDPGPEPEPAALAAARLAAAGPAEAGPELLPAGAGPGEARPTAPAGRPETRPRPPPRASPLVTASTTPSNTKICGTMRHRRSQWSIRGRHLRRICQASCDSSPLPRRAN